jgi:hypothetical protein
MVDNRRTMCDHCSLRTDLPGFISREHAEGNKAMIEAGNIFPCHMIHSPLKHQPNHVCLGAALVAGVPLENTPAGGQSEVYKNLDAYVDNQAMGRKENSWLAMYADPWLAKDQKAWWGWWAQSLAGNWHYLLTTMEQNDAHSVYLFFDQFEELFSPVVRVL